MEGYSDIIKQRPEFDEKAWMVKRTPEERELMMSSCKVLGQIYPIWFPSLGVFK